MNALDHRILSLIRAAPRTFEDILENTWGISPSDLKSVLDKLKVDGLLFEQANLFLCKASATAVPLDKQNIILLDKKKISQADKKLKSFLSSLPIPHPHDFDWRFSIPGIKEFVEHVLRYHDKYHRVCVIAAPTVYGYLRLLNVFPFLSLVERSEETVESIRKYFGDAAGVVSHDLQNPWTARSRGDFDCIIMDPPWYQDYYELFMLRATEILSPGGIIHTALFPPFAKGNGLAERSAILSFAHNRGLYLIELKSGALEYDSPFFERKTFSVDGFEPRRYWRRGDVASFFLGLRYGPEYFFQVETGNWKEYRIGRSKLKLRVEDILAYEPPAINTVETQNPYLASISRKHAPREKIGLWTSCQQAYQIKGAGVISLLIECLLQSKDKDQSMQAVASRYRVSLETVCHDCTTCFEKLDEIIEREKEGQNELERNHQ